MTSHEFNSRQEVALEGIHPELASVIRRIAYDQNHSSGYEEVLSKVESLAYEFTKVNEVLMRVGRC